MSGLTSLVDTMLPSKLAQRVDLVPLKPEVEIAGTDAVASVEKVSNDVRLPSRAAMLRQLGPGLIDVHDTPDDAATPRNASASAQTTLSAAARAISAILGPTPGIASAVRGSAPVWPQSSAPVPQQLATALARTVATSGLFYESHLAQFASGARTLTELAQEPQARLGTLQQIHPELLRDGAQPQITLPTAVQDGVAKLLSTPNAQTIAIANPAGPGMVAAASPDTSVDAIVDSALRFNIADTVRPADAKPNDVAGPDVKLGAAPQSQPQSIGTSHQPTPASVAAAYNASGTASLPHLDAHSRHLDEPDVNVVKSSTQSITTEAVRGDSQAVAGVHQDAVTMVRQQLELLAVPVFRWSGEVWPGTQMDWELSEERNNQQEDTEPQAASRTWQTRLTMTLPTLGAIEVRLSLADTQLQAHLAAGAESSIALLRNDGDDLRQRFAAAGLQLTGLQIAPLAPE